MKENKTNKKEDEMKQVKKEIADLQEHQPRKGSLGEYIFEVVAQTYSNDVLGVRKDAHDYKVDGEKIDVKVTFAHWVVSPKNFDIEKFHKRLGMGSTAIDSGEVARVSVVPYLDCVAVHYDTKLITVLSWEKVVELYKMWMVKKGYRVPNEKTKPKNDRKKHWNKYEMAMWGWKRSVDSGLLEKREDGNWYWKTEVGLDTERMDFLNIWVVECYEKFGFHVPVEALLFGWSGRKWESNDIKEISKYTGIAKADMCGLTNACGRLNAGVWSEEKTLNYLTIVLGREIKDVKTLFPSVRMYYENPKGTYKVQDIRDMIK